MRTLGDAIIRFIFVSILLTGLQSGNLKGKTLDNHQEVEKDTGVPVLQYQIFPEIQYGNNSAFFGRSYGNIMPFSSASITLKHNKTGLWVSGGTFQVFNTQNIPDQYSVSAGWMYSLNTKWQVSLSYGHYFFQTRNLLLNSTSTNLADGYLTYDWGILQTSLGTGVLFGNQSDIYNVLSNTRYFFLHDSIISSQDMLYMEPAITFIAGTQNFSRIFTEYSALQGNNSTPDLPGYGPLNFSVNLPVTYKYKQWYLELNGKFTVPLNVVKYDPSEPRFLFQATVYYVINGYKN